VKTVRELALTAHDQLLGTWFDEAGRGFIVGSHGLILRTVDGGAHWAPVVSPVSDTLASISFSDAEHGVIGGGDGVILTTIDGGLHWERRSSSTNQRLLKVQALDALRDYAVGAFGTFLSSEDGGTTWRAHKLPWDQLVSRLSDEFGHIEPNLNAVWFVSPQRGWIVGEFGLVLGTNDGGQTWSAAKYGVDLPQLYDVVFQSDSNGWIAGQLGTLMRTSDGGRTWTTITLAIKNDLDGIAIQNGWCIAVGDRAAILIHGSGDESPLITLSLRDSVLSGVAWTPKAPIAVGAAGKVVSIKLSESANSNERPTSPAVR
jgi:photosystem II stability/assembly factor-like uncharacterized protein